MIAALLMVMTACTHQHTVRRDRPLPPDRRDHVRGALEGAAAGAVFGVMVGGAVGRGLGDDEPCDGSETWACLSMSRWDKAGLGAFVLGIPIGALGLFVGAIAGSVDRYDYETAPVVTATVGPDYHGASAAWRF